MRFEPGSKMADLLEKVTRIAQNEYEKVQSMPPHQKEKILRIIMGIAVANLLYAVLGLYVLLSISATFACAYMLVKLRVDAILEKGLITYLPEETQKKLLERSLFDMLCDTWFIPRFSLIVKAIMRPFFVAINPEEAAYQLDDLPEATKRLFLQKGIVNLFPDNLKKIMIPKSPAICLEAKQEEAEAKAAAEEKQLQLAKIEKRYELNFSSDYSPFQSHYDSCRESDILSSRDRNSVISTDDEPEYTFKDKLTSVKTWLTIPKPIGFGPFESVRRFINPKIAKLRKPIELKFPKKFEKSYSLDPPMYRSEVIASSKLALMRSQSQQDTIPKWDKLDTYIKMKREKSKQPPRKATAPLKGPLHMVQKLMEIVHMGKQGVFNRVDDKKLLKIFGLSTLALLLQFTISKRTRSWLLNTFHLLMYVTGILLSSGSFALYILKLKKGKAAPKVIQQASEQNEMRETEIQSSK